LVNSDREIITRQIRESTDIVDVINGYVTLRRAGTGFKALCPFHEEKTPSFTVHPIRQTFKCFGCGVGGDVFTFIQQREKVDFTEARRMLAERAGISLENERGQESSGPGKSELAGVNQWAQQVFRRQFEGPGGEAVRSYVAGRGISEGCAKDFGLGLAIASFEGLIEQARKVKLDLELLQAAGLVKKRDRGGLYDTFRNRLMFPIHDATGRIVGFGGRTLSDDSAKYLNTPTTVLFDKSSNLFGLDRAKHAVRDAGRIVVVEGYTDCMMAHQSGFIETVATLGTALTESHAAQLRRYTDRVILVFDSDEAGQRAADRAVSVTLISGLDVALARVPEGKDPCDYLLSAGKDGFEAVLKAGIGAIEFKWRQVAREYEAGDTGPARRRAIEAYLQQLSTWDGYGVIDPIQKGLLVNELSKVLSLPAEDLHRQLQRMARRTGRLRPTSNSGGPERGAGAAAATRAPKPSADQQALRQLVAVLLNEPERYAAVAQRFDPSLIRDASLAAVARELAAMLAVREPFRLDVFIGRFESPEFARLITDLQVEGERRGACEEVVQGALACLVSCARSRRTSALAEEIRHEREASSSGKDDGQVPLGEDERLLALADSAKHPHFSPARVRKDFLRG